MDELKMTTSEIFEVVKKGVFIEKICLDRFPFISKMRTKPCFRVYKEVTARISTLEVTRFGKPKPQRRRFDAIILVKPFYSAYGNDLFSVGLEMKSSLSDLKSDNKYLEYLGFTNFFFFIVPEFLIEMALIKGDKPEIGVINATNGVIVKMPSFQDISLQNSESILRQIAFSIN